MEFNDIIKDLKIKNHPLVYAPDEDTFIIAEIAFERAKGKVLEIGAGSGYTSIILARKGLDVTCSDINPDALKIIRENSGLNDVKLKIIESDLFKKIEGKYDTVIFNPPYLPESLLDQTDPFVKSVDGGKEGYEVTKRFIDSLRLHLEKNGQALIIFSSMTKLDKVISFIKENAMEHEMLVEKPVGLMEKLYVLKITRRKFLDEAEEKGIKDIKYFACGRRGYIYTGKYKRKLIGIKTINPKSKADNIVYEFRMLQKLNRYGIGPKALFSGDDYFVYEFFVGSHIGDVWDDLKAIDKKKIFKKALGQIRQLDLLHLNKAEMSNPYKHILVNKESEICLIDFERCKPMEKPKNLTQFVSYVTHQLYKKRFKDSPENNRFNEAIRLAKVYSEEQSDENYEALAKYLSS